jgi:hypothetical protein
VSQAAGVNILERINIESWQRAASNAATGALEADKVVFAPDLRFELTPEERRFLTPDCLDGKAKNVSYRPAADLLHGTNYTGADRENLKKMMRRYYESASALIQALCPEYRDRLSPGFTSYRPAEISGRSSSWRKDDTRLHVDAFPSRPLQGLRIIRVFSNVNPTEPRIWRVGEPFEGVARRFLPGLRSAFPGSAQLLSLFKITKGRRTAYDHLMLGIHDAMKADEQYQQDCPQTRLPIPSGATWTCFTDSVSHAAMSGQFALEQTFYLPVDAMREPSRSPLRTLERLTGRGLCG